jgi:hypothetical protein
LNKVAPSGGFGAGRGICASAIVAASIALQNAKPITLRSFVIYVTVAARRC